MTTFDEAVVKVKELKSSPVDAELLELYALFKQSTIGDNNTPKPGMFDLKGKAKWNAWEARKGLTQEDAKRQYVALYEKLASAYGVN